MLKLKNKINILFLGRGPIAEQCFIKCLENKSFCIRAVCSDDNLKEKFLDKDSNIPFINNNKRNEQEILNIIQNDTVDYLISVQHPWIFSKDLLDAFSGHAFNLHNAKLPEYQGFNSISHAILNGDTEYTTTIHWIISKVDAGPIAFEQTVKIEKSDTSKSLYDKTIISAVKNFDIFLACLTNGIEIPKKELIGTHRFYQKNDIKSLKRINNILEYEEVDKKTRAFDFPPHEPAYYCFNNEEKFYLSKKYLEDKHK